MTVIRPNSISGITSITAEGTSISVFKSDGTTGGLQIEGAVISGVTTVSAGSASAPSISFNGNNTGVYSPGENQLSLSTNGTQRINIEADGDINIDSGGVFYDATNNRLGIGTTSPAGTLDVGAVGGAVTAGDLTVTTGSTTAKVTIGRLSSTVNDNTTLRVRDRVDRDILTVDLNGFVYSQAGTERARIDGSGRLLVGTFNAIPGNVHQFYDSSGDTTLIIAKDNSNANVLVNAIYHTATTGDNKFLSFYTEASPTLRGSIDYNRAAGQTRYNVSSDRRLKVDIQPAETALNILSAIQVRSYKWAETGYQINHGFVAQELSKIAPDAVKVGDDGEEVTDPWAVDNGKLVPLLTKALQETIAKIESLEARLTAAGL